MHLLVDGEYVATTNVEYWLSTGIKNGTDLTEEELSDLLEQVAYRRMYDKALTLLSARDYSKKDLSEKLVRKALEKERLNSRDFGVTDASFSEVVLNSQKADYNSLKDSANRICDRLEELGLLDDERYARTYAGELLRNKHMSARGIRQQLAMKGIAHDIAEVVVEELELDPVENILELLQTKYRTRDLTDDKQRRRTIAALARLGYSQSDIYSALEQNKTT